METTRIAVDGMTCQGCVHSLTRALRATPGDKQRPLGLPQHVNGSLYLYRVRGLRHR